MENEGIGIDGRRRRRGLLLLIATPVAIAVLALAVHGWGEHRLAAVRTELAARLGPTDLAAFNLPPVADDDNAARRFLTAAALIRPDAAGRNLLKRVSGEPAAVWSDREFEAARTLLLTRAGVLVALQRAAELPLWNLDLDYRRGLALDLPDLSDLTLAARLLRLHAGFAAASGHPREALPSVAALGRLAAGLGREPLFLAQLQAAGIERLEHRAIADLVAAGIDEPASLDSLLSALPTRNLTADLGRSAAADAAVVVSVLAPGDAATAAGAGTEEDWARRAARRIVGPLIAARLTAAALPLAEAGKIPYAEVRRRLDTARKPLPRWLGWLSPFGRLNVDFGPPLGAAEATLAARRLARRALELRRTELDDGALPATLAPGEPDPYSAEAVVYTRRPDGGATLALPQAERLWREEAADPGRINPPVFRWELPPPAR